MSWPTTPPRGRLYHEFLRVPDLSAGLYVLDAGATDPQSPHTEDELYYVVAGRAMVTVGGETRPVVPGSLVFVAADRGASLPRHRGAAGAARRVRPRGGRPRLTPAGGPAGPAPSAGRSPERAAQAPHPGRPRRGGRTRRRRRRRQERLEPRRPGRELRLGRSRGGGAGGRGTARSGGASAARVLGQLGRAQRRADARRARRTSRRRATTGPGTPSSAAGRPATPPSIAASFASSRRTPSGTRNRTVPSRSPNARYGPVSHGDAFARVDRERAERAAALGLDRRTEVGRRRGDPGRDLGRPSATRSRCCSARPPAAAPRSGRGSPLAGQPGRVEPRHPARVGEPARPDVQPARHAIGQPATSALRRSRPSGAQSSGSPSPGRPASATAVIVRSSDSRSAGSTTARKCSLMPRRCVRDAARSRVEPTIRQDRLGATRIGRAGAALDEPVVDQPVDQPRDAALAEEDLARPAAPSGSGGPGPGRSSAARRTRRTTRRARHAAPRRGGARRAHGRAERHATAPGAGRARSGVGRSAPGWSWSGCYHLSSGCEPSS